MDTSHTTSRRISKTLIAGLLALALALAGCSGGSEEEGGSGGSGGPEESSQPSTSEQTAVAPEETVEETAETTSAQEGTSAEQEDAGLSTALSGGLDEARSEAESWSSDAELYAIASLRPTMNVDGENEGWLYSFVSESEGAVISIPYRGGEVQSARGQELPPEQIDRLTELTLPVEDLVDTSEAVQRSEEVRSYLEENPQAGASAGVDSASRDEPEWILSVPEDGLQDRVSAVE